MEPVKTGIDGINITFPAGLFGIEDIAELFGVPERAMTWETTSPLKWYKACWTLKASNNTMLAQCHVISRSRFSDHFLLSINGLCFSDSALNPFKETYNAATGERKSGSFDLSKLIAFIIKFKGNISSFDVYLDDFTASISQERLNEMSQPHTFDLYIQSPFLKAVKGEKPEPRYFKGTWYYGLSKRNACEITTYNKGLSPRQKIHSKANPIKFHWQRYELRFTRETSKRLGKQLLSDLIAGKPLNISITELFRSYLRFVEPNPNNKRQSSWPLQEWYSRLLDLAEKQEVKKSSL